MKKRLICMLTVLALLLSLVPAVSAAQTPDFSGQCSAAVRWELDPAEGILTITGTGAIPDYSCGSPAPWYPARARIFNVVLDKSITAIGAYAFAECFALTEVDAKEAALTAIGECAFLNCDKLETIGFTTGKTIAVGDEAFRECRTLAELDLGAASGSIGESAMQDCEALTRVVLPKSLNRLEDETFHGCTALADITLPEDLDSIGDGCFWGCLGLSTLTIPAEVSKIGRRAFDACGNLTPTFAGDAPEFADADTLSNSFISAATLRVPYDAKGWTWPICKGYWVEYDFPALDSVFTDLVKNSWYIPSVQHVYYMGLMNGTSATTFAPNSDMTRGQLVTVLYRIAGEPEVTNVNPFTDVKTGTYYYDAVRWAQANGIVTGVTSTTFTPENKLSREQMCTILYRYAAMLDLDLSTRDTLQDFADGKQVSDYARDPMGWCVAMGFINGKAGAKLDPRGTATRVEIAKVLTAFDTYLAAQEQLAEDDWLDEYTEPAPGPDIDREDPMYIYAREIFDAINKIRTDDGLSALQWDDYIYVAARTRAEELAGENGFGHTRPDGSGYATVFTQNGITCNTRNEIIAHGYTSADSLVNVWATASSTSPVISAVVYSSGAVGVFQAPPAKEGEEGKLYYAMLVVG